MCQVCLKCLPRGWLRLKLPEFDNEGLLPPGDYALSRAQLKASMLVTGPQSLGRCGRAGWDSPWRATLVDNLAIMVGHLWRVGVTEVFVDGSFVEDKCHPNDIDGYGQELEFPSAFRISRRNDAPKGIIKLEGP